MTVATGGLDAFLRVARRAYPKDAAFAKAEATAAGLPPAFGFILECWLGGAEADVDIQCYFRPGEGGRLADAVPGDSPTWLAAKEIFGAFREDPALFAGLWLEYDLGAGDGGPAAPRLGFAHAAMKGGLPADARSQALVAYERARERCLQALAPGLPRDAALARTIERALAAMPEGTRVYGTGFAPPPAVSPLRWCLTLQNLEQGEAFLRAMKWEETDAFLATLPRPEGLDHPCLNVDLSDGLGPKVGVEYYLKEGAWRPFLEDLSRRGLCDARWVEPLLFEPQAYTAETAGADWPVPLADIEALTRRTMAIHGRMAHVKIVWERGAWRAAKAYLYGTYG